MCVSVCVTEGIVVTLKCRCFLLIVMPSPSQQGQVLVSQVEGQRSEN